MSRILTNALDDARIRAYAPSVFAQAPASKVSDRYGFLPTSQVVAGMRANGFLPFFARQAVSRTGNGEHVRHEVRFCHVDTLARLAKLRGQGFLSVPEEFDEVVLVNSHDGSTPFTLSYGVHRVLCGNGLIVSGERYHAVHIRHSSSIVDNVIEGATRILSNAEEVEQARQGMRAIVLDDAERLEFASAALQLVHPEGAPITPNALLVPRRPGDVAPDLWTTFNVVQENTIRGGVLGRAASGRAVRTRGVTSITRDHAINRMLWSLAESARSVTTMLENVQRAAHLEAADV